MSTTKFVVTTQEEFKTKGSAKRNSNEKSISQNEILNLLEHFVSVINYIYERVQVIEATISKNSETNSNEQYTLNQIHPDGYLEYSENNIASMLFELNQRIQNIERAQNIEEVQDEEP
ncbi:1257_t:CDS:2 [Racocetra fulgida]|uniref:1257_t:CDS:1 n=1 Tax=Racocetra fulgida TaxID=60492 RepID=A0A9N9JMG3_9GLOM|nr:1257_t:CDS:2 [Racocetra fulgida]